MANMMGFKKISKIPEVEHRGIYDGVLETVAKTADIYALDTNDVKRCQSLTVILRNRAKKLGLPVKVIVRGTVVCLVHTTPIVSERVGD